jgi:hypothetical protein
VFDHTRGDGFLFLGHLIPSFGFSNNFGDAFDMESFFWVHAWVSVGCAVVLVVGNSVADVFFDPFAGNRDVEDGMSLTKMTVNMNMMMLVTCQGEVLSMRSFLRPSFNTAKLTNCPF